MRRRARELHLHELSGGLGGKGQFGLEMRDELAGGRVGVSARQNSAAPAKDALEFGVARGATGESERQAPCQPE